MIALFSFIQPLFYFLAACRFVWCSADALIAMSGGRSLLSQADSVKVIAAKVVVVLWFLWVVQISLFSIFGPWHIEH
jgi:hypothetical protein